MRADAPGVPDARWQAARRILCVRLDQLGDLLMTTPAVRALAQRFPQAQLTLLGAPGSVRLAAGTGLFDEAIAYAAPWMKHERLPDDDARLANDIALIQQLRLRRFDAAVIFTVFSQSALPAAMTCRLAGIPLRLAHCRENPYRLLSDWVPEREPQTGIRHEVRRQLDLVAQVGASTDDARLAYTPSPAARASVDDWLRRHALRERRWVLIQPGASAPSRRWPVEHFAAAADGIADALDATIVFGGSADEQDIVETVRRGMRRPSIGSAGVFDLDGFAALIAAAPLLVCNNSGAAHFAAAAGTPVVVLYAQTNPQHTPWQVPSRVLFHDVPCRNCFKSVCPQGHHDCLRRVEPTAVVDAAVDLFLRGRAASAPAATELAWNPLELTA